jgi:hypothetical protein
MFFNHREESLPAVSTQAHLLQPAISSEAKPLTR